MTCIGRIAALDAIIKRAEAIKKRSGAIIKRAGAIKKRRLEIFHEENLLVQELDRYDDLLAPDGELRAELEDKKEKHKEKRKERLALKGGSSASPAKKTKQSSGAGAGTGAGAVVCPARADIPIVEYDESDSDCPIAGAWDRKRLQTREVVNRRDET